MLWIHIASGFIALLAGFVTLYAHKGSGGHRSAGRIFAYAMFVLTVSAGVIAAFLSPNPGNVLVAAVTLYLVATGWLAVRSGPDTARRWYVGLAALGFAAGFYGLLIAGLAFQTPARAMGGIPAGMLLGFGVIALLAGAGDVRLLRRARLEGPRRLFRHLWRMGLALFTVTLSFFLGQADEFPMQIRQTGVLSLPVLVVAATLIYWVARQGLAMRRVGRSGANAAPVGISQRPDGPPA